MRERSGITQYQFAEAAAVQDALAMRHLVVPGCDVVDHVQEWQAQRTDSP